MEVKAENAALRQALTQAERERDAAVEALRKVCADYAGCWGCKKYNPKDAYTPNECMDCVNACNWEWRGVQEVNEE